MAVIGALCLVLLLVAVNVSSDPVISSNVHKCRSEGVSLLCKSKNLYEIPQGRAGNHIEILEFSDNKLSKVSNNTFEHFQHLHELSLCENEIKMLEIDAFTNLLELVKLDLSGNFITDIDQNMIIKSKRLVFLSLHDNPLVNVRSDRPFLSSSSIEELDLSYCSLSSLSESSFSLLPSLSNVDLRKNDLQTLSLGTLNILPKISVVRLENNRWLCACSLGTVLKWVSSKRPDKTPHNPVYCFGPNSENRLWSEADEKYCDSTKTFITASTTITTTTRLFREPKQEEVYSPSKKSQLNESSFLYTHQANVVSVSIVLLMLFVAVLLASLLIRYFTKENSLLYARSKFESEYGNKSTDPLYEEIEVKKNYLYIP